jgi:hypothetical protein
LPALGKCSATEMHPLSHSILKSEFVSPNWNLPKDATLLGMTVVLIKFYIMYEALCRLTNYELI